MARTANSLARRYPALTLPLFAMNTVEYPQRKQAVIMLLLTNLFWGVSFPVVKALGLVHADIVPAAGTWFATFYCIAPRFVLATLVMMAVQYRSFWRMTKAEWQQGALIGLFSAAGMLLQNDGLQFTEASTSAFLTQFYAILIPLTLAIWQRRNPGASVWWSCLLVLAGVAILGRFDWQSFSFGRGETETLVCSVFFMGQIMCLGWKRFAGNRPEKITFVMFATQALIFSSLAAVAAPDATTLLVPWQSEVWLGLTLILTLFCTIGSFTLMNTWQPRISTTEAGLLYCFEPIFASIMALMLPAWFSRWAGFDYPNETVTWTLLIGGALITAANLIILLRPPRVTLSVAN